MSKKMLQINARCTISREELKDEFLHAADPISAVPGLEWKIFAFDEERAEAAGFYLFADAASVAGYLEGPIVAAMKTKPAFADITAKVFDVAEEATSVTRGPV